MPPDVRTRRIARWLLAGSVALIAYGSLYPFDFSAPAPASLAEYFAAFGVKRPSRGDFVTNLLLYLPIGLTLVPARDWRGSAMALLAASAAGFGLSLLIESFQLLAPARDPSVSDVVLNTLSAACGAGAVLLYGVLGAGSSMPALRTRVRDPAALGLLGLWLVWRCVPFVPTLDWQKWKNSLKPLLRWEEFGWLSTARYALGWLVVAQAVRLLWRAPVSVAILSCLVAVTLAAQVLVVGRTLRSTEIAALILVAAALAPLLSRLAERRAALFLLVLAAVVVIASGLEPMQFAPAPGRFSWLPFRNSLSGSMELNALAIAEKAFFYGALLWLLTRVGLRAHTATLAVVPLLALLEYAQRWLPGRSAELTDPLLAVAIGAVLAALQGSEPLRATARVHSSHE